MSALIVDGVVSLIFYRMAGLFMEIEKLKSRINDCELHLPNYDGVYDDTLSQRLEVLEYEMFGRSGRDIDRDRKYTIGNRLYHL